MNPPPSTQKSEIEITITRKTGTETNFLLNLKNQTRKIDCLAQSGYNLFDLLANSTVSASDLGISLDDLVNYGYDRDELIAWGFKPLANSQKADSIEIPKKTVSIAAKRPKNTLPLKTIPRQKGIFVTFNE
jgi:hypothetical protein